MKRLTLIILTLSPLWLFGQAVPGCGTFISSGPITATSNSTISGKSIDLGGAATVGINIPANVHDVHITKCIIKNSTALSGLIRINSGCYNITIDTCFFEAGWRGINATGATNNIHIWYNYFHNINDPNVLTSHATDGGGSSVQLNNCNGTSIQVLDNKSYHDVSGSGIGDQFSVYQCNGTAASPIRVCRNQALNGSTNIPANGYVGAVGGDVGGSFQRIDSNIFVNVGSVLAQIQGGHDIEMSYNTGFLAQSSYTSVGMAFGNYSGTPSTNITMGHNNVRAIQANGNVFNYWFDPNTAFAPNQWATNTTSTSLNASILPNPLWPPCNPVVLPPNISYSGSPFTFTVGVPIPSIIPTSTGGAVVSYTVSPTLPLNLGINSVSGIVSGTPSVAVGSAVYTVTAHNSAGTSSVPLTITVNNPVIPAPNISYSPSSATTIVGTAISTLSPSNIGGAINSWGISSSLPPGLTFNSGVISGVPLATLASTPFVVSATNNSGTSNATVTITVNPQPPQIPAFTYPSTNYVLNQNTSITILATSTGGVGTFTVTSGTLPSGITLSSTTGTLQGSPASLQAPTPVTITCTNGSGAAHVTLTFAVNSSPSDHYYLINNSFFGPIFQ